MSTNRREAIHSESVKIYDILRAPVITEKATEATQFNRYTFHVAPDATKNDIKVAVEKLYKVDVVSVNKINVSGKTKKFRNREGKRDDIHKAIVRVAEGKSIDLSAGL
jgi:large subunit ribosomal protein L23